MPRRPWADLRSPPSETNVPVRLLERCELSSSRQPSPQAHRLNLTEGEMPIRAEASGKTKGLSAEENLSFADTLMHD